MGPLPPRSLTDGTIVVRRYEPGDGAALASAIAASLEHLRPWMPWAADEPLPVEAKEALITQWEARWDAGEEFVYAVAPVGDERSVIGGSGLHPRIGPGGFEIGYWVHAGHTGRGVATATARLLTAAALDLDGTERVQIHHDRANAASAAVPRRLGYRFVEERPDEATAPGEVGIECVWEMDADRWAATPRPPLGARST